jgi:hypothetical protein
MKTLKNLLVIAILSFSFFACSKDDDKKPSDYSFSDETVDEGKANLAATGQDALEQIAAIDTVNGIEVLQSLINCLDTNIPFGEKSGTLSSLPVFNTLVTTSTIGTSKDINALVKSMKSDVEKDTAFLQMYKKYMGVYTWNNTQKAWIKTVSSSDFKFVFPAKKNGTTNDATLTLTYTGKNDISILNNYNGDMPTSLNISIVTKNVKVFEINMNASYNSEGLPSAVNYFIALTPYKLELKYQYSTSSITSQLKFTNSAKTIFDFYFTTNGNYSLNNVADADNVDNVVYSGNAYFQILNVKLAGEIDVKNLAATINALEKYTSTTQVDSAQLAGNLNKYLKLDLVYTDSEQKIASTEFYPELGVDSYYDYDTEKYVKKVNFNLGYRFIFADKSTADMDTYFGTGFDELIENFYDFTEKWE